jgi:hypothetical protein
MVKIVIKIKGRKEPIVKQVVNDRRHEMELAQNACAGFCTHGVYEKDPEDEDFVGSTLVKSIKGMGHTGNGENGTWYPPHQIEVIRLHEQ